MNFLLDLKRLIVFGDKLYNNNKFNIGFLLEIHGLITFKVVSCGRFLKIYIDVNGDKFISYQSFLILFLITDFFCV